MIFLALQLTNLLINTKIINIYLKLLYFIVIQKYSKRVLYNV